MESSRKKIVIVDDDMTILSIGKNTLIDKYDIFTIPSGDKLFKLLNKMVPDLILLDIEMPEMDGYEIIRKLKCTKDCAHIPVIFLSAITDSGSELKGLTLGAIDYITKPFSPPLLLKRIEVHMLVESQKQELKHNNENLEQMVSKKTRAILELQSATLKTIAELVECRDDVTGSHVERTQGYLRIMLGILLNDEVYREEVSSWDIDFFVLSALLHDVGKIAIKDNILLKPGKLSSEEFEMMKRHTLLGAKVIQKIKESTSENSFLKYAETLAAMHHERWDGTGYPHGLKGEAIPLEGRIMAIIDVYDALVSDRPYKKPMSHEEAVEIIKSESGTHFDPRLADLFVKHELEFKGVEAIIDTYDVVTVEKEKAVRELPNVVSNTVAEIVNYKESIEDGRLEKMQCYMKIMLNALLAHVEYKEVVSSWDIDMFLLSAKFHDVGKISVRDNLLQKPSELTEEEFEEVKSHADFGVTVIKRIQSHVEENVFLSYAKTLAGSHHEKWDGTGYPQGIGGRAIPLQGRLMGIIDVYSAVTNDRPYKNGISHEKAVEIIKNGRGTHFDPDLVDIFLEHENEFKNVAKYITA